MNKLAALFAVFALLLFSTAKAEEKGVVAPLRTGAAGGIISYTSTISKAPSVLARSSIAGANSVKGTIGESIASKVFLDNMLRETGNWHALSPRIGPTGIDHILLKVDHRTGLPKGLIVGETKYGTSRLGHTKDGLQLSRSWTNHRLENMGNHYMRMANVSRASLLIAGHFRNQP